MSAIITPERSPEVRNVMRYQSRSLWLWVAAGFLLLAAVWAVMFTAAHRAQVQSVPLAGSNGGTKP